MIEAYKHFYRALAAMLDRREAGEKTCVVAVGDCSWIVQPYQGALPRGATIIAYADEPLDERTLAKAAPFRA